MTIGALARANPNHSDHQRQPLLSLASAPITDEPRREDFMDRPLSEVDPEIAEVLGLELERQQRTLEMIESENFVPMAVLECQGSVLTNKYAVGYPRERDYGGCEHVDVAERRAGRCSTWSLTGGTDVHLVMCDRRESSLDGKQAEDRLASVGVTVSCNVVPFDPRPPAVTSGLRIGTAALATRGLRGSRTSSRSARSSPRRCNRAGSNSARRGSPSGHRRSSNAIRSTTESARPQSSERG